VRMCWRRCARVCSLSLGMTTILNENDRLRYSAP
jgi:hypothetical protein